MRKVRIYKDNIREHILRSLLFTDTAICISGGVLIAGCVYLVFWKIIQQFDWGLFIASVIVAEIFFLLIISIKIDRQPIFKVLPRAIKHLFTLRKQRYAQLDKYYIDFRIQDSTVVRGKSIIRVYEIEPFDIALLDSQEQENFYQNLKQVIHVLPSQIQLIVRRQQAKPADYAKHFFSLYADSDKKREDFINKYIEGFTWMVEHGHFLVVRYYAVLSTYADTRKVTEFVKANGKLDEIEQRLLSSLSVCGIKANQLGNKELITFYQSILR